MNSRHHPISILLCATLSLALAGCRAEGSTRHTDFEAPLFTLTTLDGDTVSLASFRGQPVVIHFGTSWCPFCRAEDSHLAALYEKYRDRGVQVLVVNVKEDKAQARTWNDAAGFRFPMLLDSKGTVAARYAPPEAQPDLPRDEVMIASNMIIDRDGVVRFFSLLDTQNFDARLVALTARLEDILREEQS